MAADVPDSASRDVTARVGWFLSSRRHGPGPAKKPHAYYWLIFGMFAAYNYI